MKEVVEIILAAIMAGGFLVLMIDRIISRRGIGVRVIQFLCAFFLIPTISILALEDVLDAQAVAALFGALIGYVLSRLGKDENK